MANLYEISGGSPLCPTAGPVVRIQRATIRHLKMAAARTLHDLWRAKLLLSRPAGKRLAGRLALQIFDVFLVLTSRTSRPFDKLRTGLRVRYNHE
jgi:hypothetical protein